MKQESASWPLWAVAVFFFAISLALGFWVWQRPHDYLPPFEAAREADVGALQYHIARGLDPAARNEFGQTLLERVVGRTKESRREGANEYEAAKLLLESGADPNAMSNDTRPIVVAALLAKARLIKLLLDYGADPNLTDARGHTALMSLAFNKGITVLTAAAALISAGADVDIVAPDGYTALKHARDNDAKDLEEMLVRVSQTEGR